jgi:hypothetical protein
MGVEAEAVGEKAVFRQLNPTSRTGVRTLGPEQ